MYVRERGGGKEQISERGRPSSEHHHSRKNQKTISRLRSPSWWWIYSPSFRNDRRYLKIVMRTKEREQEQEGGEEKERGGGGERKGDGEGERGKRRLWQSRGWSAHRRCPQWWIDFAIKLGSQQPRRTKVRSSWRDMRGVVLRALFLFCNTHHNVYVHTRKSHGATDRWTAVVRTVSVLVNAAGPGVTIQRRARASSTAMAADGLYDSVSPHVATGILIFVHQAPSDTVSLEPDPRMT